MRKLVFALLMLLTSSLNAQNDGVIKFLGIPVDGSESEMISQLKQKGFKYIDVGDYGYFLKGRFNGKDVRVYPVTNHDKVYRIYVVYASMYPESSIINEYNSLIRQFNSNSKYLRSGLLSSYDEIPLNEDIEYEIEINNKTYSTIYIQKASIVESDDLDSFFENLDNMVRFRIIKEGNEYTIALYYDNLKNAPNGEDL